VRERLGISRAYVYRLLWAGDIPSMKIGKLRKVRRSDLDAFIAARMEGGDG
jgi:excisionase family DNA binding protein